MARFALAVLLIATACTTSDDRVVASKRASPLSDGGAADGGEGVAPSGDGSVTEVDSAVGAAGSAAMETAGSGAMANVDAAFVEPDAAVAEPDAAAPTVDASTPDVDAATPAVDAATPAVDAATPGIDAATPAVDATTPDIDAATPDVDAAVPATDAGPTESDAATIADAGMHHHPTPDDDAGMEPDADVDPAEEHCSMEMPADPRDALIESSLPMEWTSETARDVLMPQPVLDWIEEQGLNGAHDAWHATRRWDQSCNVSNAPAESCRFGRSLVAQNLFRAEYQQGAPGAGFAFLHMHRHMLQAFKSAFPTHVDLFKSWTHVPRSTEDPENTMPWRTISWTEDNLVGFDILENIEQHLAMFPTEDDLGNFMESTFRWTPEDPTVAKGMPGAAMHGAIHREYAVRGSPANMGSPATSLPNYTFWKLHGFIDDVWQRYRVAKQLSEDEEYRRIARWECRLMYYLSPLHRQVPPPASDAALKRGE